jgi:hypothetical protein
VSGGSNLFSFAVDAKTGQPLAPMRQRTQWTDVDVSSLTRDVTGRRIAFLRDDTNIGLVVGGLADRDRQLVRPHRVSSRASNERPTAFTADGRSLISTSDRGGHLDVYRRPVATSAGDSVTPDEGDATAARPLFTTSEGKLFPEATPDGKSILYWTFPSVQAESASFPSLVRASIDDPSAAPVQLLQAKTASELGAHFGQSLPVRVRCPRDRAAPCILSERIGEDLVFVTLDVSDSPRRGRAKPAMTIAHPTYGSLHWNLSPDGKTISIPRDDAGVDLWSIGGGVPPTAPSTTLDVVEGCPVLCAYWNADATALFATVTCSDEHSALYVRPLTGGPKSARLLWDASPDVIFEAITSPDDAHLAVGVKSEDVNVWALEGL